MGKMSAIGSVSVQQILVFSTIAVLCGGVFSVPLRVNWKNSNCKHDACKLFKVHVESSPVTVQAVNEAILAELLEKEEIHSIEKWAVSRLRHVSKPNADLADPIPNELLTGDFNAWVHKIIKVLPIGAPQGAMPTEVLVSPPLDKDIKKALNAAMKKKLLKEQKIGPGQTVACCWESSERRLQGKLTTRAEFANLAPTGKPLYYELAYTVPFTAQWVKGENVAAEDVTFHVRVKANGIVVEHEFKEDVLDRILALGYIGSYLHVDAEGKRSGKLLWEVRELQGVSFQNGQVNMSVLTAAKNPSFKVLKQLNLKHTEKRTIEALNVAGLKMPDLKYTKVAPTRVKNMKAQMLEHVKGKVRSKPEFAQHLPKLLGMRIWADPKVLEKHNELITESDLAALPSGDTVYIELVQALTILYNDNHHDGHHDAIDFEIISDPAHGHVWPAADQCPREEFNEKIVDSLHKLNLLPSGGKKWEVTRAKMIAGDASKIKPLDKVVFDSAIVGKYQGVYVEVRKVFKMRLHPKTALKKAAKEWVEPELNKVKNVLVGYSSKHQAEKGYDTQKGDDVFNYLAVQVATIVNVDVFKKVESHLKKKHLFAKCCWLDKEVLDEQNRATPEELVDADSQSELYIDIELVDCPGCKHN